MVGLGAFPSSTGRGNSAGKKAGPQPSAAPTFKEYSVKKFSENGFGDLGFGQAPGWVAPAWVFAKLAVSLGGKEVAMGVVCSAVHVTSWAGASFELNNFSNTASFGSSTYTGAACAGQLSKLPTPWPKSFDDKTLALSSKAVIFISRLDEKSKSVVATSDKRGLPHADAKSAFAALFLDHGGERRRFLVDACTGEWATATVSDAAPTAPAYFFNSDFSPYVLLELDKSARTKAGKPELKKVFASWASLVEPGVDIDNDAAAVFPTFRSDGSKNTLPMTPPPSLAKKGAAPSFGVPPLNSWAAMSVTWGHEDTLFVGKVGAFSPAEGYKISTPQMPRHLEHSLKKNAWLRPHSFSKEHPKEQRKGFTTAIPIGLYDGRDSSIPFPLPNGTHILLDNPNSNSPDFEVHKTTYLAAERRYQLESLNPSKKDSTSSASLNALQVVHTPAALHHYLTYGHVNFLSAEKLVFRDASMSSAELKVTNDGGLRDRGKFIFSDGDEGGASADDEDHENSGSNDDVDDVPPLLPLRSGVPAAQKTTKTNKANAEATVAGGTKNGRGKEAAADTPPPSAWQGGTEAPSTAWNRGDADVEPSLVPISKVRAPLVKKAPKRPELSDPSCSFSPFLEQLEKQMAWSTVGSGAERELWTTMRAFAASAERTKFTPTVSPEAHSQSPQLAQQHKMAAAARSTTRTAPPRPAFRAQSAPRRISWSSLVHLDAEPLRKVSAESPAILSVFDELRPGDDGKKTDETESDVYRPVIEVRSEPVTRALFKSARNNRPHPLLPPPPPFSPSPRPCQLSGVAAYQSAALQTAPRSLSRFARRARSRPDRLSTTSRTPRAGGRSVTFPTIFFVAIERSCRKMGRATSISASQCSRARCPFHTRRPTRVFRISVRRHSRLPWAT